MHNTMSSPVFSTYMLVLPVSYKTGWEEENGKFEWASIKWEPKSSLIYTLLLKTFLLSHCCFGKT